MNIKHSMNGCIEVLREFEIINNSKYRNLYKRVEKGDKTAYAEISVLLEEVANSAKELSERKENAESEERTYTGFENALQ